jgi:Synergist-CTERM protein sorting domain-containing protein
MKKLSCFALALVIALFAGAAFAVTPCDNPLVPGGPGDLGKFSGDPTKDGFVISDDLTSGEPGHVHGPLAFVLSGEVYAVNGLQISTKKFAKTAGMTADFAAGWSLMANQEASRDVILYRTTPETFTFSVNVATALADSWVFCLSPDLTTPLTNQILNSGCNYTCGSMTFTEDYCQVLTSKDAITAHVKVDLTSTQKAVTEYGVFCCDGLTFMSASYDTGSKQINSTIGLASADEFVWARLSETPFVRVTDFDGKIFDVADGATLHTGVLYNNTSAVSCDCTMPTCDPYFGSNKYVKAANLGTKTLDITANAVGTASALVCKQRCGLCDYNDMYPSSATDPWYVPASTDEPCSCHCDIFPGFNASFKPKTNTDWNWKMANASTTLTTYVDGKFYTNYKGVEIGATGICPSCSQLVFFKPCADCEKNHWQEVVTAFSAQWWDDGQLSGTVVRRGTALSTGVGFADVVAAMNDENALSSLAFDVTDKTTLVTGKTRVSGVSMTYRLLAADVAAAGLEGDLNNLSGIWNKLSLKVGGVDLVGSGVLTADQLAYLTRVWCDKGLYFGKTGKQLEIRLDVFVVDDVAPATGAIKYIDAKDSANVVRKMLLIYDGVKDGKYTLTSYVAKKSAVADFAVTPATLALKVASTGNVSAQNAPAGAVVVWTVSGDAVTVSPDQGLAVVVTAAKVGSAEVIATVSGDAAKTGKCVVTVTAADTPTPAPSSSSGGCNAGAVAPLALLLLAPVAFLLKK